MTGSQKVVLFDLGGVLIESSGRDALQALYPHPLPCEEILERWLRSPSVVRFERGLASTRDFAESFIHEWRLELAPSDFMEAFAQWPKRFFDGAIDLVRAVRTQHRVGCLSNTNAIHWARFPELPSLFDITFASHLTGFMKPESEAYEHALARLDVEARHVYFFDDLLPNVEAARAVGINAFLVRSFADLEPILRQEQLYG